MVVLLSNVEMDSSFEMDTSTSFLSTLGTDNLCCPVTKVKYLCEDGYGRGSTEIVPS